jgi:hypothetical protein
VHQVGYKKLIDIMMHGQRNIKISNAEFRTYVNQAIPSYPLKIQGTLKDYQTTQQILNYTTFL